jgi:ABC-type glutathione transport system ATPase component
VTAEPPEGPLVRLDRVSKVYRRKSGVRGGTIEVTALDEVSLDVPADATLAVVGESGSGKSTLARLLALLEEPTAGEVFFAGRSVAELTPREKRALRPRHQLIFQDPAAAVNPRFSAVDAVAEPLRLRGWKDRAERRRRALELMSEVGLAAELGERSPLELSGGQKRRLVIARALAAEPRLLVLDEALTGLDLSLQAQITNLLLDLRERFALAYVFISHDLRMVAHVADRVAVMDRGRLAECGPTREILERPGHAATRKLVGSMLRGHVLGSRR